MINVLIVEDDPMARKLLEIYINDSEEYKLSQSIESAAMAELYCRRNSIDRKQRQKIEEKKQAHGQRSSGYDYDYSEGQTM